MVNCRSFIGFYSSLASQITCYGPWQELHFDSSNDLRFAFLGHHRNCREGVLHCIHVNDGGFPHVDRDAEVERDSVGAVDFLLHVDSAVAVYVK